MNSAGRKEANRSSTGGAGLFAGTDCFAVVVSERPGVTTLLRISGTAPPADEGPAPVAAGQVEVSVLVDARTGALAGAAGAAPSPPFDTPMARSAAATSAASSMVCTLPMISRSARDITGPAGAAGGKPGSRFNAATGGFFGFGAVGCFAVTVFAVTVFATVTTVVFRLFTASAAAAADCTNDPGTLRFFPPVPGLLYGAATGGDGVLAVVLVPAAALVPAVLLLPAVTPPPLLPLTIAPSPPPTFPLVCFAPCTAPPPPSDGSGSLAAAKIRARHSSNPTTCLHAPLGCVFLFSAVARAQKLLLPPALPVAPFAAGHVHATSTTGGSISSVTSASLFGPLILNFTSYTSAEDPAHRPHTVPSSPTVNECSKIFFLASISTWARLNTVAMTIHCAWGAL